ncbi:hypothetical protein MMC25_007028 [Agyrium rufum]|nr:hypothetical protein [Agyrium rufum]
MEVLDILTVWHGLRIPFFLIVLVGLLATRYVAQARASRTRISDSPKISSPNLPATYEKSTIKSSLTLVVQKDNIKQRSREFKETVVDSKQPALPPAVKRTRLAPKRVTGNKTKIARKKSSDDGDAPITDERTKIQPMVFYTSLTGTTEAYAQSVIAHVSPDREVGGGNNILPPQIYDLSYIDLDDFFTSPPKPLQDSPLAYFYLILLPSYNIDSIINNFLSHLEETHHDFRIDTAPLSSLAGYSVFGLGDKEGWPTEEEGFCAQARETDKWMAKLTGRKRAFPLGMGAVKSDAKERLEEWMTGVQHVMHLVAEQGGLGEGVPGSGDALESDEEDEEIGETTQKVANMPDLEDMSLSKDSPLPIDFTTTLSKPSQTIASSQQNPKPLPLMVPNSSPTYASLTKQGYSILGSHSGVKLCRWTKSALRGRGSCYKWTFYGIASHLCMETTPSLSCSNKCVFCWRHGTNPVSTTWRWQVDPPDLIYTAAKKEHLRRIKMMRGVPGVRAERFQEAMRIRHCALSLVGEPIFYPHINELMAMMHADRISTFLVCNAQHPSHLRALKHCTQLYVSIDASNRDSLRKIDRPLHRDFWERFIECLDILCERRRQMRTVFRLTLVKGFNVEDEVEGYAALVERGRPCFVEIKGVTYCGTSTSSAAGLTMQNVPFYEEVRDFSIALVEALKKRGLGHYGVAAEHKHSCCLLVADEDRVRDRESRRWRTRIDFRRYFELLESGREFAVEDYVGEEVPEWAVLGEGGFDPRDSRVDRKGRIIEEVA